MRDKQGRESGPTLTFRPSSSNDRRHNNLLPAATHCNNLCRALGEATNAEKSIVFQGTFDRQNFLILSLSLPPKHYWWWKNLLRKMEWKLFFFLFIAFFIWVLSVCSVCSAPADRGCCTVVYVCAGGTTLDRSDGRQLVLKEVGLQKSDLIFT